MLFNSYIFIFLFLPLTWVCYHSLLHKKHDDAARCLLVGASLFFYAWWDLSYLPLLLLSIAVNYGLSRQLALQNAYKKAFFYTGLIFNIGLLAYFKYSFFIVENVNLLGADLTAEHIVLPLAISFFTFQQIAYLVDRYHNKVEQGSLLNYTLFVTFFPQLIAGPIVHHSQMMPQFDKAAISVLNISTALKGLVIFSLGLFKKVVIADQFAVWANAGFDNATTLSFAEGWATSLSYTFQLYYDFSGYSDMAIGLALLFNIHIPQNFNSPYKASNIQDFWRRWHMTLSHFLRDYIYIPLGGNRGGKHQTLLNVFITFLIGGLWHGASWMFVIWGALHGVAVVIHRLWQGCGVRLPLWFGWLLTFMFINFCWVFFRAKDLASAHKVLSAMADIGSISWPPALLALFKTTQTTATATPFLYQIGGNVLTPLLLMAALLCCVKTPNSIALTQQLSLSRVVFSALLLVIALFAMLGAQADFLYFNF